ncbi:hypothetical protein [Bacillus infantis]|uniref:hypothetical protein n=1 Tax=Bacillus infantis TaxID=324767 RepID=UPI00209E481D|nr:hypothetical protein [Bacillus infantis]MCP1159422.1 hypothetical protein [Bacillus infantis]
MLEKVSFCTSDVITYLEEKIATGLSTQAEDDLYSDYKWSDKVNKKDYTFKKLLREMRDTYVG